MLLISFYQNICKNLFFSGGQVTWHGRGQLIAYFLFDLNRLKWHVRDLVNFAEEMMLWLLAQYGIDAYTKKRCTWCLCGGA